MLYAYLSPFYLHFHINDIERHNEVKKGYRREIFDAFINFYLMNYLDVRNVQIYSLNQCVPIYCKIEIISLR